MQQAAATIHPETARIKRKKMFSKKQRKAGSGEGQTAKGKRFLPEDGCGLCRREAWGKYQVYT